MHYPTYIESLELELSYCFARMKTLDNEIETYIKRVEEIEQILARIDSEARENDRDDDVRAGHVK